MKPAWSSALASLMVLTACSHSDPFPTGPRLGDGSFDQVEPIRLTFSTGDDGWPTVSADGQWVAYRYARGTNDRDFCAGILPIEGGQRLTSLCAWEASDASRSDDFRSAVLLDDHTVAYTRSSSGTGNQSPQAAGLYVAPLEDLRGAREVLPLLGRPAGASDNYVYLLDPVREDDHTLLALAARAFVGRNHQFSPIDTVYLGVEVTRIDVSTTPATVTPIAAATNAVAWALDRSGAAPMVYFHRRYYDTQPGSGADFDAIADTIFRAPLDGGSAEVVYGRPHVDIEGLLGEALDGFTVADGNLYVAQHFVRQPPPVGGVTQPPETQSQILHVVSGGAPETISLRLTNNGAVWTRLSATPDGRALVAASVVGGVRDLYRFDLP